MTISEGPLGTRADLPFALCLHSEESEGFTFPRFHLIIVVGFPGKRILRAKRLGKRGEAISLISLDNMGKLGYKLKIEGRSPIDKGGMDAFSPAPFKEIEKE